jgi:hypothetical protein
MLGKRQLPAERDYCRMHERNKPMGTEQANEICKALADIDSRLQTLASITASNILIPGRLQSRYHQIIEEAYAALREIEGHLDQLRAKVAYQHTRLDELRKEVLAQTEVTEVQLFEFRDED